MQKIGDITTTADPQGEFTDGNVAQGVSPTILPAAWFTTVQRELIAVLTDAGLKPDKSDDSQVSKAIQKMLSEGIDKAVVPASLTKAGITKLSNETNSDDETTAATPKSVTDALTGAKGVNLGDVMTVGARYPANGSKCTTFMSNYTPHLSAAKGSAKPALEISNQGNKDAVAALLLHREGDFATYFGLDTDNALAIGGFSLDGKRYRLYHEGFTGGLARMSEGVGWRKDENTGFIIQCGQTVTRGINEDANIWQSFNVPFHEGVWAISLTPYWPGRNAWDKSYDYGPLLGGYNNDGFNWNKQSFGTVRYDWDCGMHWLAIGK
ncbi:phage tail protein [Serratia symbiotica]|uniref:Tail fiber protein n=1 Tax=Serratia symbiotica TaxID=138074 RepID=A0A068Z166_9GAMM|nr:phage tail protein [Serratia symbiotica]QLH63166.1 hypothetical protein SYMBAF_09805 [Serratia symbiotica]CDS57174.1 hypothetical protein SYMBAF_20025 [Serratia symbiotica]CDS57539.1 hypothetical protein SYMBAF_200009 [Serratia symbiotica]